MQTLISGGLVHEFKVSAVGFPPECERAEPDSPVAEVLTRLITRTTTPLFTVAASDQVGSPQPVVVFARLFIHVGVMAVCNTILRVLFGGAPIQVLFVIFRRNVVAMQRILARAWSVECLGYEYMDILRSAHSIAVQGDSKVSAGTETRGEQFALVPPDCRATPSGVDGPGPIQRPDSSPAADLVEALEAHHGQPAFAKISHVDSHQSAGSGGGSTPPEPSTFIRSYHPADETVGGGQD